MRRALGFNITFGIRHDHVLWLVFQHGRKTQMREAGESFTEAGSVEHNLQFGEISAMVADVVRRKSSLSVLQQRCPGVHSTCATCVLCTHRLEHCSEQV